MKNSGGDKTRWHRIKSEIIKRPFIAYSIGLTGKEVAQLFSEDVPTRARLDEIDERLIADRKKKTERLRPYLTVLVGERGSAKFAEKVQTDGMTIKYIIDNKYKKPPSYDLISRIETVLSAMTEFSVSLENVNDKKNHLSNTVDGLKLKVGDVANRLIALIHHFNYLHVLDRKNPKHVSSLSEDWQLTNLKTGLRSSIEDLENIKSKVETIIDTKNRRLENSQG